MKRMSQYISLSADQVIDRISNNDQLKNDPYVRLVIRMMALTEYTRSGTEEAYQLSTNPVWSRGFGDMKLQVLLAYVIMKKEDPSVEWYVMEDISGKPAIYNGTTAIFGKLPSCIIKPYKDRDSLYKFQTAKSIWIYGVEKSISVGDKDRLLANNSRFVEIANQIPVQGTISRETISHYALYLKIDKGIKIISDKYPYPREYPYAPTAPCPTGKDLIKLLLQRVDLEEIDSRYVQSMVQSVDQHLVDQLYEILNKDDIESWKKNPNRNDIIETIDEQGYALYNHFYLGNRGYDDVLLNANPRIRL